MFLTTSGTYNFANGLLILLQLSLHLFAKYCKDKTKVHDVIISGLTLHSGLLIETHFNGFTLHTLQLINDIATTNTFLINPNFLYYIILFH